MRRAYSASRTKKSYFYNCTVRYGVRVGCTKKHIASKPVSEILAVTGLGLASLAVLCLPFRGGVGVIRAQPVLPYLFQLLAIVVSGWWRRNVFWWYQLVVVLIFFVANTFLTALPVITYGDASVTGFRVGTIPLEDFFLTSPL